MVAKRRPERNPAGARDEGKFPGEERRNTFPIPDVPLPEPGERPGDIVDPRPFYGFVFFATRGISPGCGQRVGDSFLELKLTDIDREEMRGWRGPGRFNQSFRSGTTPSPAAWSREPESWKAAHGPGWASRG